MINCVIIDDEPLALQLLDDFVNKTPFLKLAGKFEEPLQALATINTGQVDLLFIDINMPDISGIDFINSLTIKPEVIFISAYSEFAMRGFELKALDYLLKPLSFEKFLSSCQRARDYIQLKNNNQLPDKNYFFINTHHKLQKIFYDDIKYLEGFKDYSKVQLASRPEPLIIHRKLKYFQEILPPDEFIRIHHSFIISIRNVKSVSKKAALIESKQLPVGDHYRNKLLTLVRRYAM